MLISVFLLAACAGGSGNANNQVFNIAGPVTPVPPVPKQLPGGPCVAPLEPGAEVNCDFGAQERMSGVWVRGFEQSNFLPGNTGIPELGYATRDHYWLTFADGVELDSAFRADFDKVRGTAAAAVEFIGRRARAPGASPVVIVDRIIAMRVLGEVGTR